MNYVAYMLHIMKYRQWKGLHEYYNMETQKFDI